MKEILEAIKAEAAAIENLTSTPHWVTSRKYEINRRAANIRRLLEKTEGLAL